VDQKTAHFSIHHVVAVVQDKVKCISPNCSEFKRIDSFYAAVKYSL